MSCIIEGLGELTTHPDVDEWLTSSPMSVSFFGGEPLAFILDESLVNPSVPSDVVQAITNFLALGEQARISASEVVFGSYRHFVQAVGYDDLPVIERDEIWNSVTPTEIFVERSDEDEQVYIRLTCECDWEVEHGLQLIFRNGNELTRVSEQDGHLI